jgi:D-alanyl-D-alanine dipeptidase
MTSVALADQQMLVVRTQHWDAVKGQLQRYQRVSDKYSWKAVGSPVPVVVGKNGMVEAGAKKEGDLRTPVGVFDIVTAFGFEEKPKAIRISYQRLTIDSVCVDDPDSIYYNQLVHASNISHADWRSGEKMRQIDLYRIGAVISYNYVNPIRDKGSCIFLHVWRDAEIGTAGCVAMSEENLKLVLSWLDPEKHPVIVVARTRFSCPGFFVRSAPRAPDTKNVSGLRASFA